MLNIPQQLVDGCPPVTLNCACCDVRLPSEASYCPDCQTPAELSRTVATRIGDQHFVSVLGASNAGKTVYSGLLLDILSKGGKDFRGRATSAFAVDLQEQVITALQRRTFPEKTANEADTWKWLHCQITTAEKKGERYVDLISPDFAGEAIAMEVNQPGSYPAISDVVKKSAGVLILCDSLKVRDTGPGEDLFAMKLATYVAQTHGLSVDGNRKRKAGGPAIAIVFTKSDACPEARWDPAGFAENNTPRLTEFCRQTFRSHAFFAASVAGSSGTLADAGGRRMQVPFHVQPQGVVEPLRWITDQI
tara:strand:+ start:28833 stop:29747 length:915 start_codon:yes stop_codon:yes gene_type:complete